MKAWGSKNHGLILCCRLFAWLLVGFLLSTTSVLAKSTATSELLNLHNVKPHLFYLKDPEGSLELNQIVSNGGLSKFTDSQGKSPSFGWTSDRYWFYFEINTKQGGLTDPLIEFAWPLLDSLKVYLLDEQLQALQSWELGDKFSFDDRPIDHTNFVVPLELQEGRSYTILVRVESTSSIQLPTVLWNAAEYYGDREYFSTGQGLYYGAMLVMLIYNFFIFLSVRRATYFYYCGFVLGFIGLQSSLKGISFQYLWPNTPSLSDYAISTGGAITLWFVVTFAKSFLKIDRNFPKMFWTLTGFQYAISAVAVLSLVLPYSLIIKFVAGFGAVASLSCIVIGSVRLIKGQREARFYVAAWLVIVTGCILYMGKQFGILPRNFLTENSMQIGSMLEVVLLSFALADRLNTLKRELQIANRKLEAHLVNVEQEVEEKTKDIRSILKTIRQGIFMIMPEGLKIHQDFSDHTRTLLRKDRLDRFNVMDLVFEDSALSSNDKDQLVQTLSVSLGEDRLNFDTNVSCLPKEIVYKIDASERIFELDWDPITDDDDQVDRVLVSMRDITDLRKLMTKSQRDDLDLQIISEIVRVEPTKFASLMDSSFELLKSCEETLNDKGIDRKRLIEDLYRYLHTIKGQARSFGLSGITNVVHEVETNISSLRDPSKVLDLSMIEVGLKEVGKILDIYEDIDKVKLHRRQDAADVNVLSKSSAHRWINEIANLRPDDHRSQVKLLKKMQETLVHETSVRFSSIVEESFFNAKRLASDLGKAEPKLVIEGPNLYLEPKGASFFRQIFSHLMNNAVDHGLETSYEREKLGKSSQGHFYINIDSESDPEFVKLLFWDDGRGLQLERLKLKAEELGMKFDGDDSSIANLIFENGLTTAEMLTNLSGRGVGLDAIKSFVLQAGGEVDAYLDTENKDPERPHFHPFRILMKIPCDVFVDVKTKLDSAA